MLLPFVVSVLIAVGASYSFINGDHSFGLFYVIIGFGAVAFLLAGVWLANISQEYLQGRQR